MNLAFDVDFVFFFFLFLPVLPVPRSIHLNRSFDGLNDTPMVSLVAASISLNLLVLCCSLANPLIYAFYSANFKTDMTKICCSLPLKFGKRVSHAESYEAKTEKGKTSL